MLEDNDDLVHAVSSAQLVVYYDEWDNQRTLEARAFGIARGQRLILIGFQIDAGRGVLPEELWKSIDDLDGIYTTNDVYPTRERIIPAQHAGQIEKIVALAPNTGWEQAPHDVDDD